MRLRLIALIAAVCWPLAPPAPAESAVLIEAEKAGQRLRLVVDRTQQRVLLTAGDLRALVDLATGLIYLQQADGPARRVHARFRPGYTEPAPYRIERFGPGPMVAGNGSTYHVLFEEERVCAEAMLSGWMSAFVDPVHHLRGCGLAADVRQGRPADLRHQRDPVRLSAGAGRARPAGRVSRRDQRRAGGADRVAAVLRPDRRSRAKAGLDRRRRAHGVAHSGPG